MKRPAAVLTVLFLLAACESDVDVRIADALKGTADAVVFGETDVVATCKGGGEAKVPLAQLELDLLGMADIEKQTAVAQSLQQQCEALQKKKTQEARAQSALEKAAKELGLAAADKDSEVLKGEVCEALNKQLPRKGDERAVKVAQNTRDFGCPDPGEAELGPERLWEIEEKGEGKAKTLYLRLDSEAQDDEPGDQLTLKCKGKKLEAYIATRTKLAKGPLVVTVDGKKRRWSSKLSKSKKAVFLKNAKKDVRGLLGKDRLVVTLPAKGKPKRAFSIDGIEAALEGRRKDCGI